MSAAAAAINIEQNFGLKNFCHVSKLHHFASPPPNSFPADQPSGGDFLLEKTNRRSSIFGGYPILENRDLPPPPQNDKKNLFNTCTGRFKPTVEKSERDVLCEPILTNPLIFYWFPVF